MRKIKLTQDAINGLLDNLLKRSPNNYGQYADTVNEIVEAVKANGDQAVFEYTKKFDGAELTPENIRAGKFNVCLEYHIKNCKYPRYPGRN